VCTGVCECMSVWVCVYVHVRGIMSVYVHVSVSVCVLFV